MNPFAEMRHLSKRVPRELSWHIGLLQSRQDPESQTFFDVFGAVRAHRLSLEENAWFQKIEDFRQELSRSVPPTYSTVSGPDGSELTPGQRSPSGEAPIEDLAVGGSSVSGKWAMVLFLLIRAFKPRTCLELGTCIGVSALFQAAALRLNGAGRLVTLEGSAFRARIARENFARLGLDQIELVTGQFEDTLLPILKQRKPIDFAFIDGNHTEEATIGYYEQIEPYLADKAILVFDDICWSDGMRRVWKRIVRNPSVVRSFDLDRFGVCLHSRLASGQKHYPLWV